MLSVSSLYMDFISAGIYSVFGKIEIEQKGAKM